MNHDKQSAQNERTVALVSAKEWQWGNPSSNGDPRPSVEVDREWMAYCFVCEAEETDKLKAQLDEAKTEIESYRERLKSLGECDSKSGSTCSYIGFSCVHCGRRK